eukprot:281527_1
MALEILHLISLILCGLMSILILVLSCVMLQLFTTQNEIYPSVKCITLLAYSSAICGSCSIFILFILCCFNSVSINLPEHFIIMALSTICTKILAISADTIFLLQLKHTFQHSVYRLSNCIWFFLLVLLTAYIVVYSFINYSMIQVGFDFSTQYWIELDDQLVALNVAIIGIETVISVTMLLLFNGALLRLTSAMGPPDAHPPKISEVIELSQPKKTFRKLSAALMISKDKNNHKNTDRTALMVWSVDLNDKQEVLVRVITKITILVTVSVLSTIAMHVAFATMGIHEQEHETYQWI